MLRLAVQTTYRTLPRALCSPLHTPYRLLSSALSANPSSPHSLGARRTYSDSSGARTTSPSNQSPPLQSDDLNSISLPNSRDPLQHPLADLAAEEVETAEKYWRVVQASQKSKVYVRKLNEAGEAEATGRRKRSRAQIWLSDGNGQITVNDRPWIEYFRRIDQRDKILRPLDVLGIVGSMNIRCDVRGGGMNGQAEAIRHGIAKALQNWNPAVRPALKSDGLLTRDSRVVESKKYGKKKARKSFQWVKR